ncbi:MAG: lysophospholipid acyltransferase family protein [Planctomycetes bacterium]|nr:lysophospholipid acyltransferase family protein [Planctomycetota bacterium]
MSPPAGGSRQDAMPPLVRAAYWLQYAGPRLGVSLLLGMGDPMLRGLAKLSGRVAYRLDSRHRPRAEENLKAAGYSSRHTRQITRRMFEHFAASVVEGMVLRRRITKENFPRYVRLEGREFLDAAVKSGKGALFVGCHQGSWELAGIVMNLLGYPLTTIARPFKNPYVDSFLNGARGATGQKIVQQRGGLRELMKDVKGGRVGVIHPDPAPPRTGNNEADALSITAWYTALFERSIREHPEQWLWAHRRWRSSPRGTEKSPAHEAE